MKADDLILWADTQSSCCELCPRRCRVNRSAGELGACGVDASVRYFREFIHYGEEAGLSPSQTIYLTGCNLSCVFCQTASERKNNLGRPLTVEVLDQVVGDGLKQGAKNVNFLGGDPVVNLPGLIKLLYDRPPALPVVWNSNMYMTEDACNASMALASFYLADLKFGNHGCAGELCSAADYWDVVTARIQQVVEAGHDVLIRHLLLPEHLECCTRPIMEWIKDTCPEVPLSLKWEYLPAHEAKRHGALGQFPSGDAYAQAREWADELNLNCVLPSSPMDDVITGHAPADDWEIVISPTGTLYFPHPNAAAMAIGQHIQSQQKENGI